ncbi:antibiotic biosynthesis monooxygenase family protein [Psychromonas aquimarina]|uniref:antibiotic biosynthesis monooxygenase family protein n=1 Tax=Psychromonas aquimarina TaxID=444919 RepID=UPI0004029330|nr:antibiotic biosynthesis monooxygenase [Psychromonas aquimarina]
MIAVLFRWEIKPGCEQSFKEGWSEIIHRNIEKYGALGARLHKTHDNQWLSYSQWISEEHFIRSRNLQDRHEEARAKMISAISKAYEPIVMVPMIDHLIASETTQPQLLP